MNTVLKGVKNIFNVKLNTTDQHLDTNDSHPTDEDVLGVLNSQENDLLCYMLKLNHQDIFNEILDEYILATSIWLLQ